MKLNGRNILFVGDTLHGTHTSSCLLHRWGFRCHFAANIQAAYDLLNSHPIDLLLCNTHLSDGTCFDLITALAALPVTVFLCLPVENGCYWLPALDAGKDCLGSPALRSSEFAIVLGEMARSLNYRSVGQANELQDRCA